MQCLKCGFYDVFTPKCPNCGHAVNLDNADCGEVKKIDIQKKVSEAKTNTTIDALDLICDKRSAIKDIESNDADIIPKMAEDKNFVNDCVTVTKKCDGSFCLNADGVLPLSLYNVEYEDVIEIKNIIIGSSDDGTKICAQKLVPIIIKTNLRCRQIDDYVANYKTDFLNGKQPAIMPFNCPELIFTYKPQNFAEIQKLIDEYGYINLLFYVKHSGGPSKIKRFKKTQRDHKKYSDLCFGSLAESGEKIPLNEILEILSLKELKALLFLIAGIELKKKNEIMDYLLNIPTAREIIKKHISLDEFFKILPFDEKFSISIDEVSKAFDYSLEIAELISHTLLRDAHQFWNDIKNDEIVVGIQILSAEDSRVCDCCENISSKGYYKKDKKALPPFHIGCRCIALPVFLGDKYDTLHDCIDFQKK